uniref:F-box domain-containing protein n=1 Tax=Lotharella globosa TaxID=91324 RepID=A0A6V3JMK1_9EUKA
MHRRLRPMLVDNVLANICWYLTGAEVKNFVMVCKDVNQAFRKEMVWQLLCMKHNFKHQSRTRTRGRKPWKTVYQRHLCVECTAPGHVRHLLPNQFLSVKKPSTLLFLDHD